MLPKNCQKLPIIAKKFPKCFDDIIKKLPKNYQKTAKKLPIIAKNFPKCFDDINKKLPKNYQNITKKIAKKLPKYYQ